MTAKEEILALIERLPDTTTYADAFDQLRPLYNRAVAPIIAQYGEPPGPTGPWRREITDPAVAQEQRRVGTTKAQLAGLMRLLPSEAAAAVIVDEALYKLSLSYIVDKASLQIAEGRGIPHTEVLQHLAQLRG